MVPIDSHWGTEQISGEKAQKNNKGHNGEKCNSENDTEERSVRARVSENIDERQRLTLIWLSIG